MRARPTKRIIQVFVGWEKLLQALKQLIESIDSCLRSLFRVVLTVVMIVLMISSIKPHWVTINALLNAELLAFRKVFLSSGEIGQVASVFLVICIFILLKSKRLK